MVTSTLNISPDHVARHYNELDRFYRKLWGDHVHHGYWETGRESPQKATERLIDLIVEPLHLSDQQRVADVGCGYGGSARYLTRNHGVRVTGFTLSQEQAAYAETQGRDLPHPPEILVRNWLENQIPDATYDAIYSIECLAHVTDKPRYFAELKRTLKPGGHASFTAWLSGNAPTQWQTRHLLEPICDEGRLPSMGTDADYRSMIADAGLELLSFRDLTRQVEKTWSICCRRLAIFILTDPEAWRYLLSKERSEAVFIPSLWRILHAYRRGAMRYGWFVVQSPS